MDKFIIELPDNTAWLQWVKVVEDGTVYFDYKYPEDLTPYTEPDLDAIRKEVHDKCMSEAEDLAYKLYSPKIDKAYQRGLNDAWEYARKIWEYDMNTLQKFFGWVPMRMDIFLKHTASECIEKIRAYEREKELKQEENKESCQNCKFAKNPKVQEPCVRCSHSFYNFFRAKAKESES